MKNILPTDGIELGQEGKRRHIASLDGVRGIAILLVMLMHVLSADERGTGAVVRAILQIKSVGWMGVDLFFVLSGFLITGILLDALESPHYFRNFYARRTLRIFPVYYGVLILVILLKPFLSGPEGLDQVAHDQVWYWTYTSNFPSIWRGDFMPGFSHFWSLAVEEQFYLLWPMALFLVGRRGVVRLCIVCIVMALIVRCGMLWSAGTGIANAVYALMPCRIDALAFGALGAAAVRQWPAKYVRRLVKRGALVGAACWIIVLALAKGALYRHPLWETVGFSVNAILGASLVVYLGMEHGNSTLGNVFRNRTLRFFGKYSYGMYVWHMPIHEVLRLKFPTSWLMDKLHSRAVGGGMYMAMELALDVAVAVLSWHLFERHFLRLKKYFVE